MSYVDVSGECPLERLVQACGGVHAKRCEQEEDYLAEKICNRAIQRALTEVNQEARLQQYDEDMAEAANRCDYNERGGSEEVERVAQGVQKSQSMPIRSDDWEEVVVHCVVEYKGRIFGGNTVFEGWFQSLFTEYWNFG